MAPVGQNEGFDGSITIKPSTIIDCSQPKKWGVSDKIYMETKN